MSGGDSGASIACPRPDGAPAAPIHSVRWAWLSTAWAPLASTKADTMKRISPAPAAASLAHMITSPAWLSFVLLWFLSRTQEQIVIELP